MIENFFIYKNDMSLLDRYRSKSFLFICAVFAVLSGSAFLLWYGFGGQFSIINQWMWFLLLLALVIPVFTFYFSQSVGIACQSMLVCHFILYTLAISMTGYYESPLMLNLFYIPLIALLSGRAKVAVSWSLICVLSVVFNIVAWQLKLAPPMTADQSVSMAVWYQWNLFMCILLCGILALAYEKIVSLMTDVLSREKAYFERDILVDSLTGLANSYRLKKHIKALLQVQSKKHDLFMISIDIDDFKQFNASYGHHTGDQLLQGIAKRILTITSRTDVVARIKADQFIVLLPKLKLEEDVIAVKKVLKNQIAMPILTKRHELNVKCSIDYRRLPNNQKAIDDFIEQCFDKTPVNDKEALYA